MRFALCPPHPPPAPSLWQPLSSPGPPNSIRERMAKVKGRRVARMWLPHGGGRRLETWAPVGVPAASPSGLGGGGRIDMQIAREGGREHTYSIFCIYWVCGRGTS